MIKSLPLMLFLALFISMSCSGEAVQKKEQGLPCTVIRVVDGDTFQCRLDSGEEVKVRLVGIDTPESSPNPKAHRDVERSGRAMKEGLRMGKLARGVTESLLTQGKRVSLEFDVQRTDRYGRLLAYVWLPDGRMLNELLVREGYAQVYTIPPNVKYQERLLSAQRKAREEGKGLWGM
ncbi:MAG: thermonuclease family protein [Aquificaceae bacterium]|nr:thermonuclease family protein [Aquificaceae bacterium]